MDITITRLLGLWRSQRALTRVGIALLVIATIEIVGVAIYSFLLPVTG